MPEELTDSQAEELIISIISKADHKLLTREIEQIVQGKGRYCPDSAVRFLSRMRFKGIIMGELSKEHRGWVWWIEEK